MSPWLDNKWENVRSSLWFVPGLLVGACALLAHATVALDGRLAAAQSPASPYLFSGTADAARTMLSALASSLLTVLSIAFSLTMVALQQASSQFSPRVLRSITSSRVNQVVVGVYAGTFIYCLLTLRTIRGEHASAPFVPALSVTTSVLLALLCIAMLVYFIHHVSLSLQVSEVIQRLHDELIAQIALMFPDPLRESCDGESSEEESNEGSRREPLGDCTLVRSRAGGFIRRVDSSLSQLRAPHTTIWLHAKVGEYVPHGGVLASVYNANESTIERVAGAYVLDSERSYAQDPLFAVRQLVDIALRALSPGVNDPTTAAYVLHQLGDALGRLLHRRFPPKYRPCEPGHAQLVVEGPDWATFVSASFAQLRRCASSDFETTHCLLRVLAALGERATSEQRLAPIRHQLLALQTQISEAGFSEADRNVLLAESDVALQTTRLPRSQPLLPEPKAIG